MNLAQHTVLITGGSSGLGAELARQCHARGATVIITGRDEARLDQVTRELPGTASVVADLAQPAARAHLAAEVIRRFPRLSILVNNAAGQHLADYTTPTDDPAWLTQAERAQEEIAVNCAAVVDMTLRLLPALRAAPEAAVVLVSSGLALAPKKSAPVYCATKSFVHGFARSLRYQCEDGAPHVHVVEAILPLVDTPMTAGRGRGKLSPKAAARELLEALERRTAEANIGKVKLLRLIQRVSPRLADRILRNG
jgi:uncharacterized oxidoreductase